MKHAALILPTHLFADHPTLNAVRTVYLVEHPHFFTRFKFHKQKLIFHRATMKAYQTYLEQKKYQVKYLEYHEDLAEHLKKDGVTRIHYSSIEDTMVEKQVHTICRKLDIEYKEYESPYFLTSKAIREESFAHSDHFYMTTFYREQRRRVNILMDAGKPVGGRFSFDPENRKKIPPRLHIPPLPVFKETAFVKEARTYVADHFDQNPGFVEQYIYPVTLEQAKAWLDDFLMHRLAQFGTYQDALKTDNPFLFHSLLSPLLNVGLLTPEYVLEKTVAHALNHAIPLNSLEGFIRQIIGWREFVYGVYCYQSARQVQSNFFNHTAPLSRSFVRGETGLAPIDITIKKVATYAYAHHIERLMVLGNFLLLTETHPENVYRWFMEFFIDAYDWVMIPNVYGMSQYADGGVMITKPYIAGSNYLKKMGDYASGPWEEIFDSLYWNFVDKNQTILSSIPRSGMMVSLLKRMPESKRAAHRKIASQFLKALHQKHVW